jgi:nucleoside-diphosphate-sugar epimerase
MRSVLVTGAGGFIGRHALEPLLRRGFAVHALSSRARSSATAGVTHHVCDLLDAPTTAKLIATVQPTHLLHLAWCTVPGQFWSAPENLTWLETSLALVRAFHQHGGQRLVIAGSSAEYDWRYGFCSEAVTPTVPASLYGSCKLALHTAVEHYARRVGLSYANARVFFAYGPHEKPARLVAAMIRAMLKRQPAACTAGTQLRDFSHVADTAGAFVATLDSDFNGVVNLGSGRPTSVKEVVLRIADRLGARALVRLGELPTAPDEPPLLLPDVRTLHDKIGWQNRFDLDAGLEDTIGWWREHLEEQA